MDLDHYRFLSAMSGFAAMSSQTKKGDKPKHEPVPQNRTVKNTAKKVGRNDPCPCGSGAKYKKCCLKVQNSRVYSRVRVHPRPKEAATTAEFKPVTEAQFAEDATLRSMRNAGVREQYIYAYQKTGRFIAPESRPAYDEKTLAEWDAAVAEWKEQHGEEDHEPDPVPAPESEDAKPVD